MALIAGTALRLILVFERPLWSDEIFTLEMARRPAAGIVEALRLDSGPPLHYLAAHLALLPSPKPGPADVLVRLMSLLAFALHIPLFLAIGRRMSSPEAGRLAAIVFALAPLSIYYSSEGRAYLMASLLVLSAFALALPLRDYESPSVPRAVALGLAAGAAFLTHYMALFPLCGLGWFVLLGGAGRKKLRNLAVAALVAGLTVSSWIPIGLGQPRASMAWSGDQTLASRLGHFLVNLVFGAPADFAGWRRATLVVLAACALAWVVFASVAARARAAARLPMGGFLLATIVPIAIVHALTNAVLLPERTALLLLPFAALFVAELRPTAARLAPILPGLAILAMSFGRWTAPSHTELAARRLAPLARAGARLCVPGIWQLELNYRLRREGLEDRVVPFPKQVLSHPGWFEEELVAPDDLASQARELFAVQTRPEVLVLPIHSPLSAVLAPYRGRLLGRSWPFEVFEVKPPEVGSAAAPHGTR